MKLLSMALLVFGVLLSGCTGGASEPYSEKECEDKASGEEKGNCSLDLQSGTPTLATVTRLNTRQSRNNAWITPSRQW